MGIENPKNEIVTVETQVAANVDTALAEWKAYQEITKQMLDDSDYQDIKGKKFTIGKKTNRWCYTIKRNNL
mgnify:CR=1 FL=1